MGDLARKREKDKEVTKEPFKLAVGKNLWKKNMHIS